MKQLKIWNGRSHGQKYKNGHFYVAAYTKKQCAELVSLAASDNESTTRISTAEITNYYAEDSWGNSMVGIEPIEPCVYYGTYVGDPIRII